MTVKKPIGAKFPNNDIFHCFLRKYEANTTANSSDPMQILFLQVSVVFQVLAYIFLSSLAYLCAFQTCAVAYSSVILLTNQ